MHLHTLTYTYPKTLCVVHGKAVRFDCVIGHIKHENLSCRQSHAYKSALLYDLTCVKRVRFENYNLKGQHLKFKCSKVHKILTKRM
jgi:hypothetical protein